MTDRETTRGVGGMHVGSATLVMLFSVLCLTIFGVLSVVTANNALTLAEKSADSVTAYYQADCRAIEILDQVTASFDGTFTLPQDVPAQLDQVDGETRLSYWVAIDENQMLWVQLCQWEDAVQVSRWEVQANDTWNADQSLSVWGG